MSTKENKKLIEQGIKAWNELGGDIAKLRLLFDKYYASGFIYHNVSGDDMNRERAIQFFASLASASPDLNFSINDLVA